MGYSVAVTLMSKKAHNQMREFLDENFRPWEEVAKEHLDDLEIGGTCETYTTRYFCTGEELAYDKGALKLGFNGSLIGHVAYSYLRWISLKAGRKRPFSSKYGIQESVPYIVYDGHEAWPVLERKQWEHRCSEKTKQFLVDNVGFRPEYRWPVKRNRILIAMVEYFLQKEKSLVIKDRLIREELLRLDLLWQAFGCKIAKTAKSKKGQRR